MYSRPTMRMFEVHVGSPLAPPGLAYEGPLPEYAQFVCDCGSAVRVAELDRSEVGMAVAHLLALRLVRLGTDGATVEPTDAGAYRRSAVRKKGRRYGTCPHCEGAVSWRDESLVECETPDCRASWLPVWGKQVRRPGVALVQ